VVAENLEEYNARNIGDIRRVSPLFCAGITVWDALERAKLAPGETVAVIGAGGLGQLAIQYASSLGANVIALDIQDEQLKAVKVPGGADQTLNTKGLDLGAVRTQIQALNKGSVADVVIVTSGVQIAYQTALSIVAIEGRIMVVGLPKEPIPINAMQLSGTCCSLTGARIPGAEGARRCLDFSLRRNILPNVNDRLFKLEDINEMVALMKKGEVAKGRMIVQF